MSRCLQTALTDGPKLTCVNSGNCKRGIKIFHSKFLHQEAAKVPDEADTAAELKVDALTSEVEHLTYMLNDATQKAINTQVSC